MALNIQERHYLKWRAFSSPELRCSPAGLPGAGQRTLGSQARVPRRALPFTSDMTPSHSCNLGGPLLLFIIEVCPPPPALQFCYVLLERMVLRGQVQDRRPQVQCPTRPLLRWNYNLTSLCTWSFLIPWFQVSTLRKMLQGLTNAHECPNSSDAPCRCWEVRTAGSKPAMGLRCEPPFCSASEAHARCIPSHTLPFFPKTPSPQSILSKGAVASLVLSRKAELLLKEATIPSSTPPKN